MISPLHFSKALCEKHRAFPVFFRACHHIFLSNTTHWTKSSAAVIRPPFQKNVQSPEKYTIPHKTLCAHRHLLSRSSSTA